MGIFQEMVEYVVLKSQGTFELIPPVGNGDKQLNKVRCGLLVPREWLETLNNTSLL